MATVSKKEYRKRAFIAHLVLYLLVIGGLAYVNNTYSPGTIWYLYPAFGWGIGIVMHFLFGVLWETEEKTGGGSHRRSSCGQRRHRHSSTPEQ